MLTSHVDKNMTSWPSLVTQLTYTNIAGSERQLMLLLLLLLVSTWSWSRILYTHLHTHTQIHCCRVEMRD